MTRADRARLVGAHAGAFWAPFGVEPAAISTAVRSVSKAAVRAVARVRVVTQAPLRLELIARTGPARTCTRMLGRDPYAGV